MHIDGDGDGYGDISSPAKMNAKTEAAIHAFIIKDYTAL
jgi:hypothetical protein